MKTIKVKFVDMWSGFQTEDSSLYKALLHSGYSIELSESPDYLISSVFGHEALKPCYDNCIKIVRTSECACPDFTLYDYGVGSELLQFNDRFLQFPSFLLDGPGDQVSMKNALSKGRNLQEDLASKTDFCSFVYSNDYSANPVRAQFFKMLCTYKRVNSGGRYLNNIGQPDGIENKLDFQRKHKFVIAFENCSHPGYTTEKLLDAFAAHAVPIYWGDPHVKEIFNEKAFICAHDYPDLESLVERVKEVDQNDDLYKKMLAEPAFLDANSQSIEAWQEKLDAFIKHILDQPKEDAYRRIQNGYGKSYLNELRHVFFPTPIRNAFKFLWKCAKKILPVSTKRKIKYFFNYKI